MNKNTIALLAGLLFAPVWGVSQEVQESVGGEKVATDTTIVEPSATDAAKALGLDEELQLNDLDTTGFDARPYLNQKRYVPQNTSFLKKKRWSDHLYVDVAGGFIWLDNSGGGSNLSGGTQGSVFIGKEFTSVHGVRLGAGFHIYEEEASKQDQINYELRADYLCNFSAMLFGYNPKRWLDVAGVAGLSYYRCTLHDMTKNAYGLNMGLQFQFKAGSNTAVTVEPGISLLTDEYDMSIANNRHRGNLAYGVKFGLKYIFTDENLSWPRDTLRYWQKNTFYELSLGANGVTTGQYSLLNSLGYKYTISVGKWMTPGLGLKLSATAATNRWKEGRTYVKTGPDSRIGFGRKEMQGHFGGRIEALVNPFGFGDPEKFDRNRAFDLNVALGGEAGWLIKSDFDEKGKKQSVKCNYFGFTGGVQALVRVSRDMAFFLEPRITFLNYDIPYENRPEFSERYTDNAFSLNAGVRVSAPTKAEREEVKRMGYQFRPGAYVSVEGGLSSFMYARTYTDAPFKPGWAAGLAGGYRFSPYLGVKVNANYGQLTTNGLYNYTDYVSLEDGPYGFHYRGLWERKLTQITAAASLEVSLTNLYMGYNPARMFDVSLLIGPSFAWITESKDKLLNDDSYEGILELKADSPVTSAIGAEAGFAVTANLGKRFQVYLLPKLSFYPEEYMYGSAAAKKWTWMLSTFVGTSYLF